MNNRFFPNYPGYRICSRFGPRTLNGVKGHHNGIDLVARDKIMATILKVANEDVTIVISSHLVEELETVVDGVIFIKDGRNVLVGDADEIREEHGKSIADVYRETFA